MKIDPTAYRADPPLIFWHLVHHRYLGAAVGLLLDVFQRAADAEAAARREGATEADRSNLATYLEYLMDMLKEDDGQLLSLWRLAWHKDRERCSLLADRYVRELRWRPSESDG